MDQQQQQRMQMHPNMYGGGMRMPPANMMPQHPGMQPMGGPSNGPPMMGYHMSQQQHPGMMNSSQPGYPGSGPPGARMPMQMPPHHSQQQPYPHTQQQQQQQQQQSQQQHHNVPVSSTAAPGQTMPVLPQPQQQQQPPPQQQQYPYQNNVSTFLVNNGPYIVAIIDFGHFYQFYVSFKRSITL